MKKNIILKEAGHSEEDGDKSLSDFTPYNGTFAERLAEFFFSDEKVDRRLRISETVYYFV